jgi:hypothetical protein
MSDNLDAKKVKQRLDAAEEKREIKETEGEDKLREKVQATKNYDTSGEGSPAKRPQSNR